MFTCNIFSMPFMLCITLFEYIKLIDGDVAQDRKGIFVLSFSFPLSSNIQVFVFLLLQDPRVLDAMLPYFVTQYGNPHSRTHAYGWESEAAVEHARKVYNMKILINLSVVFFSYLKLVTCVFSEHFVAILYVK